MKTPLIQVILALVVSFAWIAVLFLPVSSNVQVGVQAAMMLVLGAVFGIQIIKRNGNGGNKDGE